MAHGKVKTEHTGAKNRGGAWATRAEAKQASKKVRRQRDRLETRAVHAEVRAVPGGFSVYFGGRRLVDRESQAVADRIVYFLEHPEAYDNSESAEVAESIRQWATQADPL